MNADDDLAHLKNALAGVERENTDRMTLVEKRAAAALSASDESAAQLAKETSEGLARIQEQAQRAKAAGGWQTESTVAPQVEQDDDFGFEEDEEENERRAGYTTEDPPDRSPAVAPPPQPERTRSPEPHPPARSAGRHAKREESFDEEDYAHTDWLQA